MGMGAGVGIGSFLTGLGKGFLERKDRQEKLKYAATEAGLKQLVGMVDDPTFAGDTQAKQDILGAYFSVLGDIGGGKGASKNSKGKKNDPLQHMQELVGGIMGKTYESGQGQAGSPPVLAPRPDAEGGRGELAAGSAGKVERKGPFRSQPEMREQLEQDEKRKAQVREQESFKRFQLQQRMKVAEKQAEEKQRKSNFDTLRAGDPAKGVAPMTDAEAYGLAYPGKYNPFVQKGAGAGPKAGTPVKVTLPNGETVDAWEDKYTRKFTRLDGTEIPPATIKAVNPKAAAGDKGELGEMEAAQTKVDNPGKYSASEVSAAKAFLDNKKHRDQATTIRIENSKQSNAPLGNIDIDDPKYASKVALARAAIRQGGHDPAFGNAKDNPDRKLYYEIKGQLLTQMGDTEAAAQAASFAAGKSTLTELAKLRGTMKAAENGTVAEIDRLLTLNKTLPRSKVKAFNNIKQLIDANLSDAPELARFREALLAARFRYNNMINSLKAGGSSTNAVRAETADEIINRTMAAGTVEAAANEMKTGIKNVMKGMDDAVDGARKEVIGGGDKTKGLPKAKGGGEMATKDIMQKYSEAYGGDRDKALEALKAAGYR